MKKTSITLNLNVPTFLVKTHEAISQAIAWTRWRLNGPRCEETGELLFTKYYDVHSMAYGKRIMMHQWSAVLSPEGLRQRFNRYWEKKSHAGDVDVNTCDCCGKTRHTIDIVWAEDAKKYGENLDVRFGMEWWNGFNLCQDCINEALLNFPEIKKPVMHFGKDGRTYIINEFGLKKYLK